MHKRILGFAAMAAASALVLAGCSGGGAGEGGGDADFDAAPTGTLKAWGFENADDVGTSRMDYAAEQLSDVEVDLDATVFDAQKFTTRIASGDVPDVVQMDRRYVTTYAAQGLILSLDECFAAQDVTPDEHWYPSVVDDVTYDDAVWAVPQFYQPPAILVNKTVLAEAGVTPDQIDTSKPDVLLEAIGKMYEESGGVPTRLGLDPVATGQGPLWILGMGGQLTDDEGAPTLDDESNIAGIELLKQITDAQGGFAGVKSFTDSFDTFGDNNQYVAGQVGAQVNAQWYPNVLSPYADQIDIEAVPFRDADGEPFSVASGTAFVVPVGGEEPGGGLRLDDQPHLRRRVDGGRRGSSPDARDRRRPEHGSLHRFAGGRPGDPREVRGRDRQRRIRPGHLDVLRRGRLRTVVRLLARGPGDPERAEQRDHRGSARRQGPRAGSRRCAGCRDARLRERDCGLSSPHPGGSTSVGPPRFASARPSRRG
ncbi:ABC transporter substrate-binding protein [Microbacterium sp. SA39]|uniref:ABC transporter substrate-binding protein n=1 Tax=Microbacterium sp. SA39 TaxID=1263625 RepID=UPI00061FCE34|nr:extracellular solute-binding protein [Microbacterium sp. SA39]KJQ55404.1 Bacterial extracellular solute-binding protein [Microbacterium sp. SA39]